MSEPTPEATPTPEPLDPDAPQVEDGPRIVTRLVRPEPFAVVMPDGYRYEWPEGGEEVDVLEHHRKSLLAHKGAHLVEVEVEDPPLVLPALTPAEPFPDTAVRPDPRPADPDLTGAKVVEDKPKPTPFVMATVPAEGA